MDFVLKRGLKVVKLVQACFDISNPETKNREVRALINASIETKCNNLFIITYDHEATEIHEWHGNKAKIHFVPAWEWLLRSNL